MTKIITDQDDVYIECPHCGNCESHPIDEQRNHLQNFEIVDWLESEGNELSEMKCMLCNHEFTLEWDYTQN